MTCQAELYIRAITGHEHTPTDFMKDEHICSEEQDPCILDYFSDFSCVVRIERTAIIISPRQAKKLFSNALVKAIKAGLKP